MVMRPWLWLLVLALAATRHHLSEAAPSYGNELDEGELPPEVSEMLRRDPTYVLGMLEKLRETMRKPLENTKRGIDFGLGRGYSGNQAAKHFMGLVASQYAGGPGKKRKRGGARLSRRDFGQDEEDY